ncbi:MAG: hypothetical protein GY769_08645 [bacterium]|nr:hypothetical protein [bacterium]
MQQVLARGPNFVYAEEFLRARHGEDRWRQILAALPPAAAEVWSDNLLVTGTYPFQAFKDMLATLEKVMEAIPEEETARMYEYIADRSLTTVHKFFFRFADPSFVIKRYPMLWQRFFLAGEVRVPNAEKGHAELEFELPEIFLDWLPPACAGYSKRAVELAGASDFRLSESSRRALGDGLHLMSYELSWKE